MLWYSDDEGAIKVRGNDGNVLAESSGIVNTSVIKDSLMQSSENERTGLDGNRRKNN